MEPITKANIRRLAWLNGHAGVAGLARAIGRSRDAIYKALRHPNRLPHTRAALERALPKRST